MSQSDPTAERLAFVGFTDEDAKELAALGPVLEAHADEIVAGFYRHLLTFEPTRQMIADPELKRRLMSKQRDYLLSLGRGRVDRKHLEERRRIGEAHLTIGLSPRWFLGAYPVYFSLLAPHVIDFHRSDPARAERALAALTRLLWLDAEVAMEAYIERRELQLDHLNRELSAMGRDLQRRVGEQGSQLRRTERRARAAEELASLATVVSGLAHEIGTPMNVIQGHTEFLESSVRDGETRRRLQTIQAQVDRVTRIIQRLLSMARPRPLVQEDVDVPALIDATVEFTMQKIRQAGIRIERDYSGAGSVTGDSEKLQQLLLNVVLNAIDAMPDGGTLSLSARSLPKGEVEISVRDSGIGIEEGRLSQIFEPFHTTKPSGDGSGLGLAVSREIVLDHGGSIEVESAPGSGTEFRILLPGPPA